MEEAERLNRIANLAGGKLFFANTEDGLAAAFETTH
jgi:hypothetical protein